MVPRRKGRPRRPSTTGESDRLPGATAKISLLAACLLASGAAALIYEVVWFRLLSLVMGSTAYAMASMLTAFLGGLALGAWVGGRWVGRQPVGFRTYATIELGIALVALAVPSLISWLDPLFGLAHGVLGDRFVAYNLVQFAACGVVLLAPTALMGATLPVVVRLASRHGLSATRAAGWMYAANSLGGALGVLGAGFVLLPRLGVTGTVLVAVGVNLAVAAAAFLARGDRQADDAAADEPLGHEVAASDFPSPGPRVVAWLYGVSGFAAMVLEVGWARIVGLSVGSTVYGFTITLFSYITGLAAGSWIASRLGWLARHPVRGLVTLQALVGASAVLSIPYLGNLPIRVARIFGDTELTFGSLMRQQLLLVWATILVPTLAMGAMFPLASCLLRRPKVTTGQAVGTTYAANTWGGILGSFSAGFLLIPWIGMRATVAVAGLLSVAVSLSFMAPALRSSTRASRVWAAGVVGLIAAVVLLMPGWDRSIVTSGPFVLGKAIMRKAGSDDVSRVRDAILGMYDELVDYREDATGVVTVKRQGSGWSMQVGGKSDAFSYASTQNFIAHLPLALHGAARRVLIVGLGSGSTLGSALTHPVEQVDVVEISPSVAEFARVYFAEYTGDALDDPRGTLHLGDGRNHLRYSEDRWDVIVSQPSNPWISGAAALFTREYFADLREHLAPGGVACAWFKPSDAELQTMTSVLRTWSDVFEHSFLFESRLLGEYVLIGSDDRAGFSLDDVTRGVSRPEVAADLRRIHVGSVADLLGYMLTGPEGIREISGDGQLNTDDNAFIEFLAPTGLFRDVRLQTQNMVQRFRVDPARYVEELRQSPKDGRGPPSTAAAQLQRILASKELVLEARNLERAEGRSDRWRDLLTRALELNPRDPYAARVRASSR